MINESVLHAVIHAGEDSLKALPFLFAAFLLIEVFEHYGSTLDNLICRINRTGPVIGALAGCIPQCGFSVAAVNLYSRRLISKGTLLAVLIATSDEAILIMLATPGNFDEVLLILCIKVILAIATGYCIDAVHNEQRNYQGEWSAVHIGMCGYSGSLSNVLKSSLLHTSKIFIFLFIFTVMINAAIEIAGEGVISKILLGNTMLQPVITAAFGLIPNCIPSVLLTQLYLEGMLSFASLISGLITNGGLGLLMLFKVNRNMRENLIIAVVLYFIAVLAGLLMEVFVLFFL